MSWSSIFSVPFSCNGQNIAPGLLSILKTLSSINKIIIIIGQGKETLGLSLVLARVITMACMTFLHIINKSTGFIKKPFSLAPLAISHLIFLNQMLYWPLISICVLHYPWLEMAVLGKEDKILLVFNYWSSSCYIPFHFHCTFSFYCFPLQNSFYSFAFCLEQFNGPVMVPTTPFSPSLLLHIHLWYAWFSG